MVTEQRIIDWMLNFVGESDASVAWATYKARELHRFLEPFDEGKGTQSVIEWMRTNVASGKDWSDDVQELFEL